MLIHYLLNEQVHKQICIYNKNLPLDDLKVLEKYGKIDMLYWYDDVRKDNYKHLLHDIECNNPIKCGSRSVEIAGGKKRTYPLYTYTSLCCSFDIETTSLYTTNIVDNMPDYYSAAYIMMFAINNKCILFNSWYDVRTFFNTLPKKLKFGKSDVLLTWVHNLDYETSYMKHRFNIDGGSFFGKSRQKPIKYLCEKHIYMHDSFSVTNSSLSKLAEMWKTKHQKAVGDLDYSIIRNSRGAMQLTDIELHYCSNDVFVLSDFAQKMYEFHTEHGFIPDTSTQILSKDIEKSAVLHMHEFLGEEKYNRLRERVDSDHDMLRYLHGEIYGYEYTINGVKRSVAGLVDCNMFTPYSSAGVPPPPWGYNDNGVIIYDFYQWLYRGGYAKSNARYTSDDIWLIDGVCEKIGGFDYTSSYPFVQIAFNFPMGKFVELKNIDIDSIHIEYDHPDFEKYRYIFIIEFHDIESTDDMALESDSKCVTYKPVIDNGRIRKAEKLTACLTDVDYALYKMYYKWDKKKTRVLKVWRAPAAPLPKYFLIPLCNAGVAKTKLKHVAGMEVEYLLSKGKFNSSYGLCCRQPIYINYFLDNSLTETGYKCTETTQQRFFGRKDKILHAVENDVESVEPLQPECIDNVDFKAAMKNSILSPFWGIWTSAFARFNLLYIDKQVSNDSEYYTSDILYNDTDSFYMKNPDKHMHIIEKWNTWAADRMKKRLNGEYPELLSLGQLDNIAMDDSHGETDHFVQFKTLGSKRYIKTYIDKKGKKHNKVTIAGLPKGIFENYCSRTKTDIYREFHDLQDFTIDSDDLDNTEKQKIGRKYHDKIVKINVNGEIMTEYSSCTLYNTTFKIKMNDVYMNLLKQYHMNEEGSKNYMKEVLCSD